MIEKYGKFVISNNKQYVYDLEKFYQHKCKV